jgi:hypothetical protein
MPRAGRGAVNDAMAGSDRPEAKRQDTTGERPSTALMRDLVNGDPHQPMGCAQLSRARHFYRLRAHVVGLRIGWLWAQGSRPSGQIEFTTMAFRCLGLGAGAETRGLGAGAKRLGTSRRLARCSTWNNATSKAGAWAARVDAEARRWQNAHQAASTARLYAPLPLDERSPQGSCLRTQNRLDLDSGTQGFWVD